MKKLPILILCAFLACTVNAVYAKNEESDTSEKETKVIDLGTLKAGYNIFADNKEINGIFEDEYLFKLPFSSNILIQATFQSNASNESPPAFNISLDDTDASAEGKNPSIFVQGLSAGKQYELEIKGNGTESGSYSGGITVTPVPEPETWAMMMAGVSLLGFQFRKMRGNFSNHNFCVTA